MIRSRTGTPATWRSRVGRSRTGRTKRTKERITKWGRDRATALKGIDVTEIAKACTGHGKFT